MEMWNFWLVLMEILNFSKIFQQIYRIFSENCANNLGKYGLCICRGRRPEVSKFMENWTEKSMETVNLFEKLRILKEFLGRQFYLKNKVTLLVSWKSLIILKEFRKPSCKSLRVWARNQWGLKFVEKILKFTYTNLNGKLTFYPFSISSTRTFVILYSSGK